MRRQAGGKECLVTGEVSRQSRDMAWLVHKETVASKHDMDDSLFSSKIEMSQLLLQLGGGTCLSR